MYQKTNILQTFKKYIMKATNLHQLSRELRASLISKFNLKNFSVKLEIINNEDGCISVELSKYTMISQTVIEKFIERKKLKMILTDGSVKPFENIAVYRVYQ